MNEEIAEYIKNSANKIGKDISLKMLYAVKKHYTETISEIIKIGGGSFTEQLLAALLTASATILVTHIMNAATENITDYGKSEILKQLFKSIHSGVIGEDK